MLKSIRIAGWKSIKTIQPELQLGPVNVLIGANGTGKSNLISFFRLLNALVEERLQVFIEKHGGGDALLHFGSANTSLIEAQLQFAHQSRVLSYSVSLLHAAIDRLVLSEEKLESYQCQTGQSEERIEFIRGLLGTEIQGKDFQGNSLVNRYLPTIKSMPNLSFP